MTSDVSLLSPRWLWISVALAGLGLLSACQRSGSPGAGAPLDGRAALPPVDWVQAVRAPGGAGPLPYAPETVHERISPTSEDLVQPADIPETISAADLRADLDTLAAAIRTRMPYVEAAYNAEVLERRLDSLKQVAPGQTRDQRLMSLFRLVNAPAPGTGHTYIDADQRALGWRALPIEMYRFADGVYVLACADSSVVGSEVLAVGGTPIDRVYDRLAPYTGSDNRWQRDRGIERQFLAMANPLAALGIVDGVDTVPIRIRTEAGEIVQLDVQSVRPASAAWVRYRASGPAVPSAQQWSPATRRLDPDAPAYRVSYRDSTDLLYLQFNTTHNASPSRTIADLADRLRRTADREPIDKVVVDLRTNTGGNNQLVHPLVDLLGSHPRIDRRGVLYTLLSPVTFSAAGSFAGELERRTKTLFAGEPSGFAPNIWGEGVPVVLPRSRVVAQISYAYYQSGLPDDPRTHIAPELPVPLTADQHFSNDDRVMQSIRDHEVVPRETVSLSPGAQEAFVGTYRLSPVHLARVRATSTGLHLQVTGEALHLRLSEAGPAVFLDSDLHAVSGTRLATDIRDTYLTRTPGDEGLSLVGKDTTYALSPAAPDAVSAIAHVRAGDLARGAAELRAAMDAGMKLGNNLIEYPFTFQRGRPETVLPYAEWAARLRPTSWRVQANLARAYARTGQTDRARKALRTVRRLDVRRYPSLSRSLGLEASGGV